LSLRILVGVAAIVAALVLSLSVKAEGAERSMLKVTIAVSGMMKSKSGAT